jgi:glutamine amidotransferase
MDNLSRQGLVPFLSDWLASGRPFLGICLGLQLLFEESEEFGTHRGIGFFPGKVVRFPAGMPSGGDGPPLKIPHMGWNRVDFSMEHPVLAGIPSGSWFYFVHSYHVVPADEGHVAARSGYGIPFVAAAGAGKRLAVQFHPEKSQRAGLALLGNFGRLCREAGREG